MGQPEEQKRTTAAEADCLLPEADRMAERSGQTSPAVDSHQAHDTHDQQVEAVGDC